MSALVKIYGGIPVTTSVVVAENTDTEHASVLSTIRKYLADFQEFGGVRFEIEPFETSGGTQTRHIALLNEEQANLLGTYMRNSDKVRKFKIELVREFTAMKHGSFGIPRTMAEALRLAADQCEQIEAQQLKIKHDAPKVELVDNFLATENGKTGSLVARELAKEFVIGRNRLYDFLVEHGIFNAQLQPKQEQVEAGRFYMQPSTYKTTEGVLSSASVRFTAKGVFHVRALLQKHNFTKRSAA